MPSRSESLLSGARVVRPPIHLELLLAYGRSQSNVTRLRNGSLNVADDKTTEVAQKMSSISRRRQATRSQ